MPLSGTSCRLCGATVRPLQSITPRTAAFAGAVHRFLVRLMQSPTNTRSTRPNPPPAVVQRRRSPGQSSSHRTKRITRRIRERCADLSAIAKLGKMLRTGEVVERIWRRVSDYRVRVVPGTALDEAIEIDRLIWPLRYDIWVRIEFVRLLRDEWTLYQGDFQTFRSRPATDMYQAWFKHVCCFRYNPALLEDPVRLEAAFIKRVHRTAQLWRSIEKNGFDASNPIRLMTGRSVKHVNGKVPQTSVFAGDGCHRLACLRLTGQRRLQPSQYEVAIHPRLTPIDNTAVLIDSGVVDREAYVRYLSQYYCDGATSECLDVVLEHVYRQAPDSLPELESVLAHDLTRLGLHT